ncbi:MAG: hypothetical protein ACFFDT_25220 [Candidatus Hodarchaeota archaeon]
MKIKILAIYIVSMFLLTSTFVVIATSRTNPIKTVSSNSVNNEGNGIRITVRITFSGIFKPLTLRAMIQSNNSSHYLDGTFTIKLTYKDNELFFEKVEGGFYSSFGYMGIYSKISYSRFVIGKLFVDFTGSGKDFGLYESITLPAIIFKTKPYTWGQTPW